MLHRAQRKVAILNVLSKEIAMTRRKNWVKIANAEFYDMDQEAQDSWRELRGRLHIS